MQILAQTRDVFRVGVANETTIIAVRDQPDAIVLTSTVQPTLFSKEISSFSTRQPPARVPSLSGIPSATFGEGFAFVAPIRFSLSIISSIGKMRSC